MNVRAYIPFIDRYLRILIAIFFISLSLLAMIAPIEQHFYGYPAGEEIYSLFNTICHQFPTRSLWIFDRPFALCARCTTGYLGVGLAALFIKLNIKYFYRLLIGIIILIIAVIDPILQLIGQYESNNLIRIVTGILGGASVFLILYPFTSKKKGLNNEKIIHNDCASIDNSK